MKPNAVIEVLKTLIPRRRPVLLVGPPGVGKTDLVYKVQQDLGYDLIVSHPVTADPTDAKGLAWPDHEKQIATFLPFGDLARAINATRPTIWFLDDLGQASPAVQAAFMQLILARRIDGHVISDFVTFVAATNRRQDRAAVAGVLEPVKSRFVTILNVETDLDTWCVWAYKNHMPSQLIAFLRMRETKREPLLHRFEPSVDLVNSPSPRTWANLGNCFNDGISQFDDAIAKEVYGGSVGQAAADEFMAFLKIFKEIPNPDAVLLTPHTAAIPDSPNVLFALTSALIDRVSDINFGRFLTYATRLYEKGHAEFAALMARDALVQAPEVQHTPEYTQFILTEFGKTLTQ